MNKLMDENNVEHFPLSEFFVILGYRTIKVNGTIIVRLNVAVVWLLQHRKYKLQSII